MRIKVQFDSGLVAYQFVVDGTVTHYEDEDGNVLFTEPPIGDGSRVIE